MFRNSHWQGMFRRIKTRLMNQLAGPTDYPVVTVIDCALMDSDNNNGIIISSFIQIQPISISPKPSSRQLASRSNLCVTVWVLALWTSSGLERLSNSKRTRMRSKMTIPSTALRWTGFVYFNKTYKKQNYINYDNIVVLIELIVSSLIL